MRLIFISLVALTLAASPRPDAPKPPFSLAVVPSVSYDGEGITMAPKTPQEFYVVLTNQSQETQAVWETRNSWGYQTISFELTTAEGKTFIISKRQQGFTKNAPTTFLINPGEHQVFAIRLDDEWETHPMLPKRDEMSVRLKAVYEVPSTAEATKFKVWTGRIESHSYNFMLRQW